MEINWDRDACQAAVASMGVCCDDDVKCWNESLHQALYLHIPRGVLQTGHSPTNWEYLSFCLVHRPEEEVWFSSSLPPGHPQTGDMSLFWFAVFWTKVFGCKFQKQNLGYKWTIHWHFLSHGKAWGPDLTSPFRFPGPAFFCIDVILSLAVSCQVRQVVVLQ